jgi:hypothetical protein
MPVTGTDAPTITDVRAPDAIALFVVLMNDDSARPVVHD